MDEPIRQDRRYKWFRPRRAMRGAYVAASTTNHGTFELYNQSTGDRVLVVRSTTAAPSDLMTYTIQQGTIGTHIGTEHPLITDEAPQAGQIWYADQSTKITPDYLESIRPYPHDFPFCVIQPGWGLIAQDTGTGGTEVGMAFIWEAIEPVELDWLY